MVTIITRKSLCYWVYLDIITRNRVGEKMKQLVIIGMITISLLSCRVEDLYHAVDQYAFLVRIADLTQAILDDSSSVDWEALQQLQLRYKVDLVGPTNRFYVAALELKEAYTELQEAIAQEEYNINQIRALSDALEQTTDK